jgi:hypothetical protein
MRTTCGAQKPYAAAMVSIAWKSMIQDADSGDSLSNGGSRLWAISLGTFFLALKRKFLGGRTKPAKLKCYRSVIRFRTQHPALQNRHRGDAPPPVKENTDHE